MSKPIRPEPKDQQVCGLESDHIYDKREIDAYMDALEAENAELRSRVHFLESVAMTEDHHRLTRAVELLRVEPLNEIARGKHRKIVDAFLSEMEGEPMNPSGNSTLSVPDDAYVPGD